jgi:hypothetical protein
MNAPILTNIKTDHRHSEETPCFEATLTYAGTTYRVSNEGRGGANNYYPLLPREIEAELDRWTAATQPAIQIDGMTKTIPMNFETWTFGLAFDAP